MSTQKTGQKKKKKTSDLKKVTQNNPPAVASSPASQARQGGQGHERAGKFTIQVSSLKDSGVADKLVSRLKKGGFPAYRSIGKIPGKGIWYRVRVGYFNSRSEAGPTIKQLKKEKIDGIIVQR